jgi:NAD(P)-dependent dehydrogenase (short-subunit alcohol dehydrogenase family)
VASPFDFSGRRAVVTGAAGGIGRAVAELLLECGAAVLATDVSAEPLTALAAAGADTVGVNAKAVYFLCQEFGPLLSDGGSIVTVSSVSARSAASLEQSVYCASKAAVSSITRSFAYAYAGRGIRVNAVLPGIIDTPMQERFLEAAARARGSTPEAVHEARLKLVPLGRTSPPRECAETIVWLLSPAAGYLTGQQIAADGGLTMY